MDIRWSLTELYTGFDSKEFKEDMKNMEKDITKLNDWSKENFVNKDNPVDKLEIYISMVNNFSKYEKLSSYSSLTFYADTTNDIAFKNLEMLEDLMTDLVITDFYFETFLTMIDDLPELIEESEVLKAHEFYLIDKKENAKYLLSEKEELLISKLKTTGSSSWEKQRDYMASMLMVDITIDGEEQLMPFSSVRNLAYDKNQEVRKNAYEAELKSYKKIDSGLSFSLNSIKGEVITESKLRGYKSPLDMTLINARMDNKTLDAMFLAMKEAAPSFNKFFKKKAEMLGHKGSLPFYDLFAPIGDVAMEFTYDDAKNYIIENFTSFSKTLGDYAKRAFDNNWVDVYPREGKTGGAFCSNIHSIGESRFLTNFTGSLDDVVTLAHELGHGYHGERLMQETYLNSAYSMPIAETASTICETIVLRSAMSNASEKEKLVILENDITGMAQVIIDIYSRFLFEDELFKRRKESSLSVDELNNMMIRAQKEAYQDGLDENFMHEYMWACKGHYYDAGTNYYNFPYAYGLLFSKGLYSLYLEQGQDFITLYDEILTSTGKNNLYDVAKLAGIDVHDKNFWLKSIKLIEKDIDEFVNH